MTIGAGGNDPGRQLAAVLRTTPSPRELETGDIDRVLAGVWPRAAKIRRRRRLVVAGPVLSAAVAVVVVALSLGRGSGNDTRTPVATQPTPKTSSAAIRASGLFRAIQTSTLDTRGADASLVGMNAGSLYAIGTFTDPDGRHSTLIRVDRATLAIRARAAIPNDFQANATVGDGAVWWATGLANPETGCNCTPAPPSRQLLRIDPTSLAVTARFTLAEVPELVTITNGALWVATPTHLLRIDPATGSVLRSLTVPGAPTILQPSGDGTGIYLVTASATGMRVADYDATTGYERGTYQTPDAVTGPLGASPTGVWLNIDHMPPGKAPVAQLHFLAGPSLTPTLTVPASSNFELPYIVGNSLWLIDNSGSNDPTICADPTTGRTDRTGEPLGTSLGFALSDNTASYLLRTTGYTETLIHIAPHNDCRP